jgi:hypothetical protein
MNATFIIDVKAVVGLLTALLGYIVTNGALILPTLPANYQHAAGAVIGISGIVLTFISNPPVAHTPAPPAIAQGPKGI